MSRTKHHRGQRRYAHGAREWERAQETKRRRRATRAERRTQQEEAAVSYRNQVDLSNEIVDELLEDERYERLYMEDVLMLSLEPFQ